MVEAKGNPKEFDIIDIKSGNLQTIFLTKEKQVFKIDHNNNGILKYDQINKLRNII